MSEHTTLGHWWHDYETQVLPDPCSELQLTETRRAFYAGARAFICLELSQPEDSTDAELDEFFRIINIELEAFFNATERGEA